MALREFSPKIEILGIDSDLIRIKSIAYSRSIRNVAGTWNATYTAAAVDKERSSDGKLHKRFPKSLRALAGCDVLIYEGGLTFLTGFVDHVSRVNSDAGVQYVINGRSRTCDFCDSSIGEAIKFKNVDFPTALVELLLRYGKFNLAIKAQDFRKDLTFTTDPTQTGFKAIEDYLRATGVLFYETTSGNLVLSDAGEVTAFDAICEPIGIKPAKGWNVAKRFSVDVEFSGLANEYRIISMGKAGNHQKVGAVMAQGNYVDARIRDTKRIVVKAKTAIDGAEKIDTARQTIGSLTSQAEWMHAVAEGKAISVSCELAGWLQTNGDPWRLNQIVNVVSPDLFGTDEFGQLLIVAITQTWSEAGASTTLELGDPGAFRREELARRKKSSAKANYIYDIALGLSAQPTGGKSSGTKFSEPTRRLGRVIDPDDIDDEERD